ncbi:MAG: zinc-binding dehydrogenase [Kiritimatiellae bacterium]|nr:zinc-binding dehydrogenase [Kiritimatiellia bacterium]
MKNLNIVFTSPNVAEVIEKPVPAIEPGKVLIRTRRSCISSGTERANLIGDPMIGTNVKDGAEAVFPRHLGYSLSGVVEAVGDGVKSVKPGDRVAASWTKHSTFNLMPECGVYLLPDGVSFEEGAWTHISTFPMAALRKCRFEFGESVLVMGFGVLGQFALLLARAAGAAPVIVADPVAAKRERALALGADLAFDPSTPDFADKVKAATDGGARVVVEVTGVDKALDTALDATARFGRVALLGCTRHSTFAIDYYRKVHGRGVTLVGAHTMARPRSDSFAGWWTERDDALAFLRMLSLGRLSLAGFTEEVHAVAEGPEVYKRLAAGGPFPNVQFDWEA